MNNFLFQCAPGLSKTLLKEMSYRQVIDKNQKVFSKRQRNHDLIFVNEIKNESHLTLLRVSEAIYHCPIFGRFKISKNQLETLAQFLKTAGPRRLASSIAGSKFQRHEITRWIEKELKARGYEFDPENENEVSFFAIDENYYFAQPITKMNQLDGRLNRDEERIGSLPPTIAAAMVFASVPKPDDIILDCVCGSGTLLQECYQSLKNENMKFIGLDIDRKAIQIADKNLKNISNKLLINTDSTKWTSNNPITLSLSNLPFGKQYGSKENNLELYYKLIQQQLHFIDKKRWRGIFLTSDNKSFEEATKQLPELSCENLFHAKIRGESSYAFRLKIK